MVPGDREVADPEERDGVDCSARGLLDHFLRERAVQLVSEEPAFAQQGGSGIERRLNVVAFGLDPEHQPLRDVAVGVSYQVPSVVFEPEEHRVADDRAGGVQGDVLLGPVLTERCKGVDPVVAEEAFEVGAALEPDIGHDV